MEEEQSVAKLPLIEAECSARLGISNIDYDQDQHGGVGSLDSAGAPVETRSTAVLCICTFAAACAAFTGGCLGAWLLDLGRLSLGIGFGLTCYVGPVYLAEITPKNVRGLLMSISQSMTGYGASFTFLVGSFVTWRSLAIIGCIPSLLLLLALFFIPESPRWLDYIENQRLQQNSDDNVLNLFRRKYLHIVIIGVGLMVVQTSDGLCGFLFYMSEIFDSAGISSTLGFILVAVVQIPSFVLTAALIDKFGRRTLLMASATGQCLGCFLTGLSYFLQVYKFEGIYCDTPYDK
ncbi:hypothetical protein I3842_07G013400 [Carya illinoinensis]|uniref:Major facilitator superfamily (MFS) profile domain-containing protein n=1 Tax=Carya illinoinensis TaxID=32201 RepID=A0A922EHW3_CARIL|nr:hypothetical protein I3842_07G013400 [Carya illinoinensis]